MPTPSINPPVVNKASQPVGSGALRGILGRVDQDRAAKGQPPLGSEPPKKPGKIVQGLQAAVGALDRGTAKVGRGIEKVTGKLNPGPLVTQNHVIQYAKDTPAAPVKSNAAPVPSPNQANAPTAPQPKIDAGHPKAMPTPPAFDSKMEPFQVPGLLPQTPCPANKGRGAEVSSKLDSSLSPTPAATPSMQPVTAPAAPAPAPNM